MIIYLIFWPFPYSVLFLNFHYTHDTDYQIQSRNKIELRQQSFKYSVIYHSLLLFVIWFGGSLVFINHMLQYTKVIRGSGTKQ
jgi:uncharacterized membrane protein SpoIIM required for sporulation